MVDEARGKGAQLVVVLSHNGMDVDLKMASRVTGIDAILGGHTHDGVPQPVKVKNARGVTLVTNAGSNGKFLGVLDFDVKGGKVRDFRYKLLPVFANVLPADPEMAAYIARMRAPYAARLSERLAVTEGLLRRGNFNGTFDQLISTRAGRQGRRDRVLAGIPLGHEPASGSDDHDGAPDGPDRRYVSVFDGQ
jgi:sulfur-oxidizing protein SoxB